MGYVEICEMCPKNNMIGNGYHIKLKDNTELAGIPTVWSVGTDLINATFNLKKR